MKPLSPKQRILKERGLLEHQPAPRKQRRIVLAIEGQVSGISKTPLMRYLEEKYKQPIENMLVSGSLSVVAKRLGNEADTSTLSRWIKRFRLRYNANNLPNCKGCRQYGLACEGGICYVLIGLGLYELVPIKKKEVLSNEDE